MTLEGTFRGKLFQWHGMQGAWFFVYVSDSVSKKIRKAQEGLIKRRGFGAVRVEVKVGKTTWKTSFFPTKEGPYLLPVKVDVRKKEGLDDGDTVSVGFKTL